MRADEASPRHDDLVQVLERSQQLGFLGPGPVTAHIEHASVFLELVDPDGPVLDLGSGGGVPGLVLAPQLSGEVVLVEASARRCRFLEWAVAELRLHNATVRCGRAEELARAPDLRARFPTVVSRSFGPPAVTAECARGFLAGVGSQLLVSEPPAPRDDRWPSEGLAALTLGRGVLLCTDAGTVQELVVTGALSDRVPRRIGIPAKRPLF